MRSSVIRLVWMRPGPVTPPDSEHGWRQQGCRITQFCLLYVDMSSINGYKIERRAQWYQRYSNWYIVWPATALNRQGWTASALSRVHREFTVNRTKRCLRGYEDFTFWIGVQSASISTLRAPRPHNWGRKRKDVFFWLARCAVLLTNQASLCSSCIVAIPSWTRLLRWARS